MNNRISLSNQSVDRITLALCSTNPVQINQTSLIDFYTPLIDFYRLAFCGFSSVRFVQVTGLDSKCYQDIPERRAEIDVDQRQTEREIFRQRQTERGRNLKRQAEVEWTGQCIL